MQIVKAAAAGTMESSDVVRNELVRKIVQAYEDDKNQETWS